jgi:hypothetical protein
VLPATSLTFETWFSTSEEHVLRFEHDGQSFAVLADSSPGAASAEVEYNVFRNGRAVDRNGHLEAGLYQRIRDCYSHVLPSMQKTAAAKMQSILGSAARASGENS